MSKVDSSEIYGSVVKRLGYSDLVSDLAEGVLQLSGVNFWSESPIPPAFIPFYSEAAGNSVGLWKHWFSGRNTTIVNFSGSTIFGKPRIAFELATSIGQLKYIYFMNLIAAHGEIDDDILSDADQLEFEDLETSVSLLRNRGQKYSALLDLEVFKTAPPLSCFTDNPSGYNGDFPTEYSPREKLNEACMYEIHSFHREDEFAFRERILANRHSPPWLQKKDMVDVFLACLSKEDLTGAWMALNSIGWKVSDAREAISALEKKANDSLFSELAKGWVNLSVDGDLEY